MKIQKALLPLLIAAMCMTGCNQKTDNEDSVQDTTGASSVAEVTEGETEEEVPPTNAAFPDADPNSVTFEDGNCAFVSVVTDDDFSAEGTLSVEKLENNYMLKFTDTSTTPENYADMVQKLKIDVLQLLTPDQIASVHKIGFDIYAEATDDIYVNEDGVNTFAPGWIGGGGGTTAADGEWYGFADFSAYGVNEYVLQRSDAYRVEFTFLLASAGKKWDSSMEECYVQIMRWGMGNISNLYIDNITFYDEEGNSIPLTPSAPAEGAEDETAAEETEAETAAE